ncbi:MAG: SAM-dependent methyltransferase [Candidatus Zapsychrus exili]|nr:SAM-dependent methyltransferase [Candidatus Zapsychrus exili]
MNQMALRGGTINKSPIYKVIVVLIILSFISSTIAPISYAQILPAVGTTVSLSAVFNPVVIKGLKLYPSNPLKFDFIVDQADSNLVQEQLKQESTKLIKYFLASLTTPEDDMWVNLNPKERDRIIPQDFGVTQMGRDLLAQDYILKQITVSLMHPEKETGKKFWDKIYKQAFDKYGVVDIDTDVLSRVWIVPEKAVVYEAEDRAFVVESKLKVLLEEEYLNKSSVLSDTWSESELKRTTYHVPLTTNIIKSVIVPALEKEVNQGKHFAPLRQIYHSMILATWYKRNLKETLLGKVYIDQNKTKGVDIKDKDEKFKIYNQYLESFKQGAYNYIKEEYDPVTQEIIPKKYFSGGLTGLKMKDLDVIQSLNQDQLNDFAMVTEENRFKTVTSDLSVLRDQAMMASKIRDDIAKIVKSSRGEKVNFAEFMKLANTGYYSYIAEIGKNMDFDTFAEKRYFGEAVSNQIIQMWEIMGKSHKFSIVEMGAGNGVLAFNVIDLLRIKAPGLFNALEYVIVDVGDKLVGKQKEVLKSFEGKVRWIEKSIEDIKDSDLKDIEGVFLSNELVDDLPGHRIKKVDGSLKEIYVIYKDGEFRDEIGDISETLEGYISGKDILLNEGEETIVRPSVGRMQKIISNSLKKGFVLTIDYGGKIQENVEGREYAVWGGNKENIAIDELYGLIGASEITSDVDFYDIVQEGKKNNIKVNDFIHQRNFIGNLVDFETLERLPNKEYSDFNTSFGFKVLVQSKGIDESVQLEGFKKNRRYDFGATLSKEVIVKIPMQFMDFKFIVISDFYTNVPKDKIRGGIKTLESYIRERGYVSYGFVQIESISSGYFKIKREHIKDMVIRDDKGNVVFNAKEYFEKDSNKIEEYALSENSFIDRYSSRLDLSVPYVYRIPKTFHLEIKESKVVSFVASPISNFDQAMMAVEEEQLKLKFNQQMELFSQEELKRLLNKKYDMEGSFVNKKDSKKYKLSVISRGVRIEEAIYEWGKTIKGLSEDDKEKVDFSYEYWLNNFRESPESFLIKVETTKGEIAGMMLFKKQEKSEAHFSQQPVYFIDIVEVLPSFRGKGFFTILMAAVCEISLKDENVSRLDIERSTDILTAHPKESTEDLEEGRLTREIFYKAGFSNIWDRTVGPTDISQAEFDFPLEGLSNNISMEKGEQERYLFVGLSLARAESLLEKAKGLMIKEASNVKMVTKNDDLARRQHSLQKEYTKIRGMDDYKGILFNYGFRFKVNKSRSSDLSAIIHLTYRNILKRGEKRSVRVADAGCGLGVYLSEIMKDKAFSNRVETYGVDAVDWKAKDFSDKALKKFHDYYSRKYDLEMRNQFLNKELLTKFVQADIAEVEFSENEKPDIITSFYVLQYHKNPLAAWVNLFNQMEFDGSIFSNFVLPKERKETEQIIKQYREFVDTLQKQGVDIVMYLSENKEKEELDYIEFILIASPSKGQSLKLNFIPEVLKPALLKNPDGSEYEIQVVDYHKNNDKLPVEVVSVDKKSEDNAMVSESVFNFDEFINTGSTYYEIAGMKLEFILREFGNADNPQYLIDVALDRNRTGETKIAQMDFLVRKKKKRAKIDRAVTLPKDKEDILLDRGWRITSHKVPNIPIEHTAGLYVVEEYRNGGEKGVQNLGKLLIEIAFRIMERDGVKTATIIPKADVKRIEFYENNLSAVKSDNSSDGPNALKVDLKNRKKSELLKIKREKGKVLRIIVDTSVPSNLKTSDDAMLSDIGDDVEVVGKIDYRNVFSNELSQEYFNELIENNRVFIKVSENDMFEFQLVEFSKDKWYSIVVKTEDGREIGYFDFRLGIADYGYDREDLKSVAIEVKEDISKKYKGIGRALVSFALAISKVNGRKKFFARSSAKDKFWNDLGFINVYKNNLEYSLENQPILNIIIKEKELGGIDLNASNLEIESMGEKIDFNDFFNVKDFQNIEGFVPVIIDISPVTNVYQMLGLDSTYQVPAEGSST